MSRKILLAALVCCNVSCNLSQGQEPTAEVVATGLQQPVFVTASPGDTDRLFIVELPGRILIVQSGELLDTPFLDIRDKVEDGGSEQGLLGLAFHPDYDATAQEKGQSLFFYVHYSGAGGQTVLERYEVSGNPDVADPDSGVVFLTEFQPFSNHNGGMLAFRGTDAGNYLYLGLGDGGWAGDPRNRAQDTNTILGKILRIDVDAGAPATAPASNPFVGIEGDDLIWVYGLRNPWRFSFDRETGDMYIGDVGQNEVEEIDFQSAASVGGENFGWRLLEGSENFNCGGDCINARASTVLPIHEYTHDTGISVTGGYVYRGAAMPSFQGHYFFADFSGKLWSFRFDGSTVNDFQEWTGTLVPGNARIASFGEDANGELYIVDLSGVVYKIVPIAGEEGEGEGLIEPEGDGEGMAEPEGEGAGGGGVDGEVPGGGEGETPGEGEGQSAREGEGGGSGEGEGAGEGRSEGEGEARNEGRSEGFGDGEISNDGEGEGSALTEGQPEGSGDGEADAESEGAAPGCAVLTIASSPKAASGDLLLLLVVLGGFVYGRGHSLLHGRDPGGSNV